MEDWTGTGSRRFPVALVNLMDNLQAGFVMFPADIAVRAGDEA
jgi:hypothetical protein